jgi:hypothetical protein
VTRVRSYLCRYIVLTVLPCLTPGMPAALQPPLVRERRAAGADRASGRQGVQQGPVRGGPAQGQERQQRVLRGLQQRAARAGEPRPGRARCRRRLGAVFSGAVVTGAVFADAVVTAGNYPRCRWEFNDGVLYLYLTLPFVINCKYCEEK